jgi:hypothetical protein
LTIKHKETLLPLSYIIDKSVKAINVTVTSDEVISTDKINNDAITTAKLGTASITSADISADIITGQSELSETAADTDFIIIYDTSTSSLKKILRSNIVLAAPTISSISPTNVNSTAGSTNFTITGTGFSTGSTARLIGASGQVKEFTTIVRNSTTQITGTIDVANLDEIQTPYGVQVTNGSGVSALLASQIDINQAPVFVTASGSLGTQRAGSFSATIEATDPDSTSVIQYEISSGSLPTGITLNGTTGVISGSITPESSDTTYTFTIRAFDTGSNTSTRSFSITLSGPSYSSFTSSGTFSVPSGVTAVDVLIVAGGGGGSSHHGGGGGAGGLIFRPAFTVTPGGTVAVTVGCGGAGGYRPSPNQIGLRGQDSVFGTLTAKGGGGGTTDTYLQTSPGTPTEQQSGGSGGGTGYQNQSQGGPATQPTRPGDSGTYGFGNAGGYGSGYNGASASGGGGGGAGTAGQNAGLPSTSGVGGNGKSYTIADGTTPVFYAGGGGGGTGGSSPANGGPGGQGGGGTGGPSGNSNGQPGTANRGGGGGGGTTSGCFGTSGGTGGKGIVIVKY